MDDIKSVLENSNFKSILVTGPWGSGKTHLLNEIYKSDGDVFHISLQGCRDEADIRIKILQSMGGYEKGFSEAGEFIPELSISGVDIAPHKAFKKGLNLWSTWKLKNKEIKTIILDDWKGAKLTFKIYLPLLRIKKKLEK